MLLQVEEPSRALDIGQRLGAGHFLPFEDLARAERPLELADELLEVVLHHPVERHQVAVEVVENLHRGSLGAHEVQRGTASEDFDVAFVRGKRGIKRSARRRLPPIQGMIGEVMVCKSLLYG